MARISTEKDLEMLCKNSDGTYTKYNPQTKAKNVKMSNGKTVESELADNAKIISTAQSSADDAQGKANSAYEKAEQAFQSASNGKTQIASAITGKGVSANKNDTFNILANKISKISTGKKWAIGQVENEYRGDDHKYYISYRNLNFKPRTVILIGEYGGNDLTIAVCSHDNLFGTEKFSRSYWRDSANYSNFMFTYYGDFISASNIYTFNSYDNGFEIIVKVNVDTGYRYHFLALD